MQWAIHQPFPPSVTLFYTDDHRIPSNIIYRNIPGKEKVFSGESIANTCSSKPKESGVRLKSKKTATALKVKSVSRLSHYPGFAILAFPCLHLCLGCNADSDQFCALPPHSKCSSATADKTMWQWIKSAYALHEDKKTMLMS